MDMETGKLKTPNAASAPQLAEAEVDEVLAARFHVNKDLIAGEILIKRYQDAAYRAAFSRTGNAVLAEEAVQESFIQLTQGRNKFEPRGPGSFKLWFLKVVRNQANMLLRHERVQRQRTLSNRYREHLDERTKNGQNMATISSTTENAEVSQALDAALLSLRTEIREPLTLHFVEGLSQDDVSKILGISQQMVHRRLEQGLEALRKRLTQKGITTSTAAIPVLFANATPLSAPAGLTETLKQIAANPSAFSPAAAVSQSVRAASFWSSHKTFCALAVIALCATVGGLYSFWPATPTTSVVPPTANSEESSESSPNLWFFDFNHGKPTELRYIQGNWEHRPTDGVGDSGALFGTIVGNRYALLSLPENCPSDVVVSFDCRMSPSDNRNVPFLDFIFVSKPVQKTSILGFTVTAFDIYESDWPFDGLWHRVEVHFSLKNACILVLADGHPTRILSLNKETLRQTPDVTPSMNLSEIVLDNLSIRALTKEDDAILLNLLRKIETNELETYDYYYGLNMPTRMAPTVRIVADGKSPIRPGGRPRKGGNEFNLAWVFQADAHLSIATAKGPNRLKQLVCFDYMPENAEAADPAKFSCHINADWSVAEAQQAELKFREHGSPLKRMPVSNFGTAAVLNVGQWHELEFFVTNDIVIGLADGRPWFAGKDPRGLKKFESIGLFFRGDCRVDNLRGRAFNQKDEARLKELEQSLLGGKTDRR